ncbi:MAG: hypothetical protein SWK76_10825 [Actinomycetota bacterium]|nr:hypothetical protein [Actinomycetota bacterium]
MARTAINSEDKCFVEEGLALEAHGISIRFASEDRKTGMRVLPGKGPGKAEFIAG